MSSRLTLMGEARLIDDSGQLIRLSPKAFGLAAVIVLSPFQVVSRAQAAELLWGPNERRFGNLRKLLWATKTSLRIHRLDLFVSTDDLIRIEETSVRVDVTQLMTVLLHSGSADPADLPTLYGGDLLEGLPVDEPEFLDWLNVQRAKLRNLFLTAMGARLATDMAGSEPARKASARRVLEIDPYNESACRTLMKVLAREGESAQVRDLFQTMIRRLADDLATSPSAATTRLYRELMAAGLQELSGPLQSSRSAGATPGEQPRARPLSTSLPALSLLRPADAELGHPTAIGPEALDNLEISLSRSKLLRIIAPGPTWSLEADNAGWPAAYGITYAIHAALGKAEQATQLHIRLVEIAGRTVIWAERLSLDARDPNRCREMIASLTMSIINQIERHELGSSEPENRTPYHWYLAGRYCLRTMDLPSIRRGRRAFRAALDLDPDFIPALVGTARALQLEWLLLARGDMDILAESENLARRAIRLDPEHAVAHRVLGFALLGRRSYPASAEAYVCAERLNPMHPDTLAEHGIMLTQTNQLDPGREKLLMAFRLNPAPPDYYYWGMAWNQYLSGQSGETIETAGAMQNPSTAYRLLASAYARLGDATMAQHYVAKVLEIHPDFKVADWVPLVPLRDRQHIDYYTEGLRLAGFS